MRTELTLYEYSKGDSEPLATVRITFETEGHGDDITIVNRITGYVLNEICRKSGGIWGLAKREERNYERPT